MTETAVSPGEHVGSPEDRRQIQALRAGDEQAFSSLIREHHASLLRVAMMYVSSRAVAEEVVQETWLGVIRGIDRFEGRSSLKTWIFRILANTAKTRGEREGRSVPFSSLAADEGDEGSVDPDRFLDAANPAWSGHWNDYPRSFADVPEQRLLSGEVRALIEETVDALPRAQRLVIRLRDIEGFSSEDVCAQLGLTEGNQRVLLHRARSKIRAALEPYLETPRA